MAISSPFLAPAHAKIDFVCLSWIAISLTVCFCGFLMFRYLQQRLHKAVRLTPFLDKSASQFLRLASREFITPDTLRLQFVLPSKDHCIGIPTGHHMLIFGSNPAGLKEGMWNGQANDSVGKRISRPYTPVSTEDHAGVVDFVIKVYRGEGVGSQFIDGGKLSQYLETLKPGDELEVSGPVGRITYHGFGRFERVGDENSRPQYKKLAMIAGGTGITPIYQIIQKTLRDSRDPTELWLLYANRTPADIILRNELEELATLYPRRFRLWYTVERVTGGEGREAEDWKYAVGLVNEEMCRQHLPPASAYTAAVICGPPAMNKLASKPSLAAMGYDEDNIFQF